MLKKINMNFMIFSLLFVPLVRCNIKESSHHRVRRIVGGEPANYPPYDDPVVYIRFNGRAAKVQGVREFPHYVFKGIKFAHPPTRQDRFLRPREKFLEGEVNATKYPPPCVQPVPGQNRIVGDEDCLALNIYTPDLPSGTEGLPVTIFIHGGGFRYGSASQYGARHLIRRGLLVVSIQYRLGSLGFLSSGSKQLPGNVGLWDMALAVKWVRNYIGFFGGNPHRIIVWGHDTGASSAVLLALSNIAKGVPVGVIAMSGTAVSRWAVDTMPTKTAEQIAEQNACPANNDVVMVKCLQQKPAASIIQGDSHIELQGLESSDFVSGINGRMAAAPVAEGQNDGRSLPGIVEADPVESMYHQENPKIPILTGVTRDETKRAVTGHLREPIVKLLTSVPDFIHKVLVKRLQDSRVLRRLSGRLESLGVLGNVTNSFVTQGEKALGGLSEAIPLNFDNYLMIKKNDIRQNLDKIAEATADALFNVPAFLTAQLWKDANSYLYSFEHAGNMPRGDTFLKGLLLIGNGSQSTFDNKTVGHGDELGYIFEANDVEGNPLPTPEPTEDDIKVRRVMTEMIAEFARHGEITISNKKVPSFNLENNNFVQIKPDPVVSDKFKFCEMALWTRIGQRLKSTYCQFLKAVEGTPLAGASKKLQNLDLSKPAIPALGLPQKKMTFLGGNTVEEQQTNSRSNSNNPFGILG